MFVYNAQLISTYKFSFSYLEKSKHQKLYKKDTDILRFKSKVFLKLFSTFLFVWHAQDQTNDQISNPLGSRLHIFTLVNYDNNFILYLKEPQTYTSNFVKSR